MLIEGKFNVLPRSWDLTLEPEFTLPASILGPYLWDVGACVTSCDIFIEKAKASESMTTSCDGIQGNAYVSIFIPGAVGIMNLYEHSERIYLASDLYIELLLRWRQALSMLPALDSSSPSISISLSGDNPDLKKVQVLSQILDTQS
jgi:hypothetical protein